MTSPDPRPPESVIVIGGGLIGLAAAYYLSEAGLRVTVLERDLAGSGASRGNAGEICPDLVEPLPAPGVVASAVRGLNRPHSALYVHPQPSWELLRFLVGFGRNATGSRYAAGARALSSLAAGTRELFDALESVGVGGDANKRGFLFAFPSRASATAARDGFARLGAAPATGGLLDRAAIGDLEPALSAGAACGFLVEDQWSMDPSLFVDRMVTRLRAQGVRIIEGARVTSVRESGGRTQVRTGVGDYDAHCAVVAAGTWSGEVLRQLGVSLGIFPGKGYSFSVAARRPLRGLVHLGTAHVVLTPIGDRVRVAGTMEFDRDPDRFRAGRIRAIVEAARPYLRDADWEGRQCEWVGSRPMTPDGLPLIGRVPGCSRVFVAAGHNMLGLMLAPATGRLVTDLVTGAADPSAAAAFAPARLARRVRRDVVPG